MNRKVRKLADKQFKTVKTNEDIQKTVLGYEILD